MEGSSAAKVSDACRKVPWSVPISNSVATVYPGSQERVTEGFISSHGNFHEAGSWMVNTTSQSIQASPPQEVVSAGKAPVADM
jgi:hypothetical protein